MIIADIVLLYPFYNILLCKITLMFSINTFISMLLDYLCGFMCPLLCVTRIVIDVLVVVVVCWRCFHEHIISL